MNSIFLVSYLALWLVVLLLLAAFAIMARQVGLLHRRIIPTGARMTSTGPEIGETIHARMVSDLEGNQFSLGGKSGKPTLLTFVSAGCSSCAELAPAVRSLWKHERSRIDFVIISLIGTVDENRQFVATYDLSGIPYIVSHHLAREFKVLTPPYSVFLSATGEVKSKGIVNRLEHLESILNAAELNEPSMESYMRKQLADASVEPAVEVAE